jgi:hypothetical protein
VQYRRNPTLAARHEPWRTTVSDVLELAPTELGTLDLEDSWVPYADLVDLGFMPTRVRVGGTEYAFSFSTIIRGHGATLPGRIRQLRAEGKMPIVFERGNRYYVFVGAA